MTANEKVVSVSAKEFERFLVSVTQDLRDGIETLESRMDAIEDQINTIITSIQQNPKTRRKPKNKP